MSEAGWFCEKIETGNEHCDFCKYNEKAVEIQTRFFCPVTGVEPNRKDCTNEEDDVQSNDEAGIS